MSFLSCTNHSDHFNLVAAIILAIFTVYGILASLLLVYVLSKVPLHPMAKSFSLVEAISRLLYCALVEPIKIFFFFTSCQPNWSLISKVVFGIQADVLITISLLNENDLRGTHPGALLDRIYIRPITNCSVIPRLSFVFVIPCMVFFFLSCIMRCYMIVVRPLHQETLAKPTQITGFTLVGIFLSLQFTGWILATQIDGQNQSPFTLACEAPNMFMPSMLWRKSMSILLVVYLVALILSIMILYKVKKSSRATSDSPLFKLAVYTCVYVTGFAFMVFATILVEFINSTNMIRALIISFCGVLQNAFIPTLMIWTSTECWQASKIIIVGIVPCLTQYHSGQAIDHVSKREGNLALAVEAQKWRRQQSTNVNSLSNRIQTAEQISADPGNISQDISNPGARQRERQRTETGDINESPGQQRETLPSNVVLVKPARESDKKSEVLLKCANLKANDQS